VKNVGRITRTSHLFGFALLLAGCADHQPTSPDIAPELGPVAVGSIIKSSVVTSTTFCRPSGECSTSTRYSEISEKVGRISNLRTAMGISVGGGAQRAESTRPSDLSADAPRTFKVSGLTLSGDAVNSDGSTSHVEFTGDGKGKAGARGKLSGIRVFRDGKPTLAFNVDWKDVGGVSYRGHSDLTLYRDGKLVLHQKKEYSPIAVAASTASDKSAATLTLSNDVYAIYGDTSCPFSYDVCVWMGAYTPSNALNSLWTTMANVGYGLSNWWNSMWAGADADTTSELADSLILAMDVYSYGGMAAFAATILSIASGGLTDTLIITLGDYLEEWLLGLIVMP
jgi:hypothetical protein